MVKRDTIDWYGCPIRFGSAAFGDIWSMLILRDIMFKGARHFKDFLNAGEGISTNILAERLGKLEDEGILWKLNDSENGARFIYQLTTKGKSLVPVMLEIIDWSERWDIQTEVPEDYIAELREDRAALARKTIAGLKQGDEG